MFLGDLIERYRKSLDDIKVKYKPWNASTSPTANSTSMVPQVNSPVDIPASQSMAFPTNKANPAVQKAIQPMEEPSMGLGQTLQAGPGPMIQGAQDQATLYSQGMRQGLGASTESQARQMGYEGQFSPEASQSFAEQSANLVMGSTGELGAAARGVGKKVAKNFVPKIDLATQKEMMEVIDYARLKPGFNQKIEENASILAEKFGINGKSITDIANKFDNLMQKIKGKKGYPSALKNVAGSADDQRLIEEAKKFKTPEEFVDSQFNTKPSYAMGHRPTRTGATAADITASPDGMGFPADFYSHPEYYENMSDESVKESFNVLKKIKGNPEAEITIYRAAPKDEFNPGDWISLSKKYANGESLQEGTNVYAKKVKAKDVQFAGDSINEFGYYPESKLTDIWNRANKSN